MLVLGSGLVWPVLVPGYGLVWSVSVPGYGLVWSVLVSGYGLVWSVSVVCRTWFSPAPGRGRRGPFSPPSSKGQHHTLSPPELDLKGEFFLIYIIQITHCFTTQNCGYLFLNRTNLFLT